MIQLIEIQANNLKQIENKINETSILLDELGYNFHSIANIIVSNGYQLDGLKTVAIFIKQ